MTPNKFVATLGLVFSAAALNSAFADPAENCGVVKQTFVANDGKKWAEPVVACKDKKGVWENRDMQRHITAGAGTEDEINAGYGVSDDGIVTTYFVAKDEKTVEVENCKDTAQNFRFWTTNKETIGILNDLISETAGKNGYSENFARNMSTAYLEVQNGATKECEARGFTPMPSLK